MITIDQFKATELHVGKIMSAEKIPETDKLLKLSVDFGALGVRQVISGIALTFTDPAVLVGTKVAFVTNLEPRTIRGLESQAMILAASGENGLSLVGPLQDVAPGTRIG